jgi:type IV pilus assembly protein PilY1
MIRFKSLLLFLPLALTSLISHAEDVEIYQGQAAGVRPNVILTMDTSRSMSYWEEEDLGPFDPTVTYPKPIHGFDPDGYYYSLVLNGNGTTDSEIALIKQRYFHPDALVCEGAKDVLKNYGVIHGKFKRWDPIDKDWETPLSNLDSGLDLGTLRTDALLECKGDEGRHPAGKYIDTRGFTSDNQYTNRPKWNYSTSWLTSINHLYTGNYLNYQIFAGDIINNTSKMSRMVMARSAITEVVNTVNGIRLGLMRFSSNNQGGFVDVAVDDVEKVRSKVIDKMDTYFTWGGTPLSETYHEAALYLRGQKMRYGDTSESVVPISDSVLIDRDQTTGLVRYYSNLASLKTIDTTSVPDSLENTTNGFYQSPIINACQSDNSIILFTDGIPMGDENSNAAIRSLIKGTRFPAGSGLTLSCSGEAGCADELAYYLANHDQNPDLPGKQIIRTFVVGGFFDPTETDYKKSVELMESIAKHGKGKSILANNHAEIVTAINEFIVEIENTPATFVAPAISANSYNSLEHLDDLYYAMFAPSGSAKWTGNLKAYRLSADGTIVDSLGNPAIHTDGTFRVDSRSYWTSPDMLDGAEVHLGGAASLLTGDYKIYTHLSGTNNADLVDTLTTSAITKSMLGLADSATDAEHQALINWGNRLSTVTADGMRREMEDPLHSRPVVVNYSTKLGADGKLISDSAVFVATNSGYLHAFKADKNNFKEYFSFIPKELLPNLNRYKEGANQSGKIYGLDGHITYWHQDKNQDRIVDSGEKVLLFVGMRRGGRNYYAIDISNRDKPKFAWQISGGTAPFANLGQSWSEMTVAKVPWQGTDRVVLLFGGGYDPIEDDRTTPGSHSMGNSVYMVDAETGKLLWHASDASSNLNLKDMKTGIVSNVRPVDVDGNGLSDYFFVADVGGKIWRFDINEETTNAGDFAQAGVIFDANGDASTGYQRFFNTPSVSYFVRENERFLTLSIGSGYRAHPLQDTATDSFYIIKDYNVLAGPGSYTTVTPNQLAMIGDADATDAAKKLGFRYDLPGTAEKVLATALTTNDTVYFTAFTPTPTPDDPATCLASVGTAHAYSIKIPHDPKDEPEVIINTLESTIPPPQPIEILPPKSGDAEFCAENPGHERCFCAENPGHESCADEDSCESAGSVILSGTETLDGGVKRCDLLKKLYWREN